MKPPPDPLAALTLGDLLDRYHLTATHVARITGRPASTVRRWIKTGKPSPEARQLLEIHAAGRLPSSCASWRGWQMRGQWLIDPDGGCYEATEIRSRWLLWQMIQAERARRTRAPEEPQQLRLF